MHFIGINSFILLQYNRGEVMKFKKIKLGIILTSLLGTSLIGGCTPDKGKEGLAYVTIETNPSVELVIGDNNIVVAVNGLNEDGKLLIASENLVGLDAEEAASKIIELTEKLGFTVQGSVDEESQEIKISVTGSNEDFQEALKVIVKEEVEETIEKLNIDAKLVELQAVERAHLETLVLEQFPTLTEEEVKAMSNEELYSYLQAAVAEKALFASVKLEEYYQDLKEYEFKLKYKEELAAALEEKEGVLVQALYKTYNSVVTSLHEAINSLQQKEVEFLTSSDSSYVQALNSLNSAKDEVIGIRVELAARENKGFVTDALVTALNAAEVTLTAAQESLAAVETVFVAAIDASIAAIEAVLSSLQVLEANFPSDIDFNAALTNAETSINEGKDALFAKFESSFQEGKLSEVKVAIDNRKDKLEALVESKKQKVENDTD